MDNENVNPENENTNRSENNGNVERFVERGSERLAVPENFWDKEKNAPDTFAILKSAMDYRNQLGEDTSPKDGVYQINIPEEFKSKLQADPEDPLYKEFCKIAKAKRMSQKEFDSISAMYYKTLASNIQEFDSDEYMENEVRLAKEKFGDDLDKVKHRIENFVNNSGITDKDILNEIGFLQTSAAGIALLDYMLSLRGEPMPQTDGVGGVGTLSRDELMKLMQEPGYQDGTDKALIEKVTKGFEQLYKTY